MVRPMSFSYEEACVSRVAVLFECVGEIVFVEYRVARSEKFAE